MATLLIGLLEDVVLGKITEELQKMLFGSDDGLSSISKKLDHISKQIEQTSVQVMNHVAESIAKNDYRKDSGQIVTTWMRELRRCMKEDKEGKHEPLRKFRADMQADAIKNNGITTKLDMIHSVLVQTTGNVTNSTGLIASYSQGLQDKLGSGDPETGIMWYIQRMQLFVLQIVSDQLYGLYLQLFIADTAESQEDYIKEMGKRFEEQVQSAYDNLHPFVRLIKPNLLAPTDSKRWWRILTTRGGPNRSLYADENGSLATGDIGFGPEHFWHLEYPTDIKTNSQLFNGRYQNRLTAFLDNVQREFTNSATPMLSREPGDKPETKVIVVPYGHVTVQVQIKPVYKHDDKPKFMLVPQGEFPHTSREELMKHWLFTEIFELDPNANLPAPLAMVPAPCPEMEQHEGELIRFLGSQAIYLVLDQTLRCLNSPQVAVSLFGDNWIELVPKATREKPKSLWTGEKLADGSALMKKVEGSETTYYLLDNTILRKIKFDRAIDTYRFRRDKAIDLASTNKTYPLGRPIGWQYDLSAWEGQRVRTADGAIYLVLDEQLRHIANMDIYASMFGGNSTWREEDAKYIKKLPLGPALLANPALVSGNDGKYYLIDEGRKRHLYSMDVVRKYGFDATRVVAMGDGVERWPTGNPILG